MSEPLVVDLFVEDRAHEVFVGALTNRIAREEQVALILQARSARGGHPRALGEFGAYQGLVEKTSRRRSGTGSGRGCSRSSARVVI